MLGKLFKHEFLDLFKKTILFFSIVVGLSLLVFLFGELADKYLFFSILNGLFVVGYIFSIIGIIAYSVFYPVFRFYKSMLKDEGYLTHTLPVTIGQLLFTKFVSAFILFLVSVLVVVGSVTLTGFVDLNIVSNLITIIHPKSGIAYLLLVIMIIITYYSYVMIFIAALALGHSRPNKKGVNSIFAGLIIYGVQQGLGTISYLIMYLVGNFNNPDNINFLAIFIVPMIMTFIIVVAEIIVTKYFLTNKLNLE